MGFREPAGVILHLASVIALRPEIVIAPLFGKNINARVIVLLDKRVGSGITGRPTRNQVGQKRALRKLFPV